MKASKLKGLRIEMGFTQSDMATIIEKSTDTYAKKERGEVMFTPSEMCLLATALKMTFAVFNYIFLTTAYRSVIRKPIVSLPVIL